MHTNFNAISPVGIIYWSLMTASLSPAYHPKTSLKKRWVLLNSLYHNKYFKRKQISLLKFSIFTKKRYGNRIHIYNAKQWTYISFPSKSDPLEINYWSFITAQPFAVKFPLCTTLRYESKQCPYYASLPSQDKSLRKRGFYPLYATNAH